MFALYQRFIEQVKEEDVQKYNEKHRDYLIRVGKIKDTKPQKENIRGINKVHHAPNRQRKINDNSDQPIKKIIQTKVIAENFQPQRPLKANGSYKLEQEDNITHDIHQQGPIIRKLSNQQDAFQRKNKTFQQISTKTQATTIKNASTPLQNKGLQAIPLQDKSISKSNNEFLEEENMQIELFECPEGCGKKFGQSALPKHIKICQKGQKKRKVFKVKIVDEEAQQLKKDQTEEKPQKKASKVPKWKKQSQQLRKGLNSNKPKTKDDGTPLPPEQPEQDDRIACGGCGRKFNSTAADKHIPKCIQRNKGKK